MLFSRRKQSAVLAPDASSARATHALLEALESRQLLSTVTLNFDGGAGGIANTGFTSVLPTSSGKGLITGNLALSGGKLNVTTTAGDFYGTRNTQDDALNLGVNASADFSAWTRITSFNYSKNWQNGGLFVGTNQDNYVKLVVGYNGGVGLQFSSESNAAFKDVTIRNMSMAGVSTLDLRVIGTASSKTLTAQYRINSNAGSNWVSIGTVTNANVFSSAARAGIVSTNYGATPVSVAYDSFEVTQADAQQPTTPAPSTGTLSVAGNVNASRMSGNQGETEIAINPTNPNNVVIVANNFNNNSSQLLISRSFDGGTTWNTSNLGGTQDHFSSSTPRVDPHIAFDAFGNCYVAYEVASSSSEIRIMVARSSDGGASFTATTAISGQGLEVDYPILATGPDATDLSRQTVWVAFTDTQHNRVKIAGARSTGLGNLSGFSGLTTVSDSAGSYGTLAVGPLGQVVAAWQTNLNGQGPAKMYMDVDADGLGTAKSFGSDKLIGGTNVGGFDYIPAQPDRSIDANVGVAFDRSSGAARGRLYVVYTDEPVNESNDTNVYLRYSDNLGSSWSSPVKVNNDSTNKSQFLPAIAVDQSTGNVAITWRDARNSANNTGTELWGTVSIDHGASVRPNVKLSAGMSNQAGANSQPGDDLDYGDYQGVAFANGKFIPVWTDNSNSTGNNPNGANSGFDLYTVIVSVS